MWIAIASICVTLAVAALAYIINGMLGAGRLTAQVSELSDKTTKIAATMDRVRDEMVTPKDLEVAVENAVLKLKVELFRDMTRRTEKA